MAWLTSNNGILRRHLIYRHICATQATSPRITPLINDSIANINCINCFSVAHRVIDHVLQTSRFEPNQIIAPKLNFTDVTTDAPLLHATIPPTFHHFYNGSLPDFVETPKSKKPKRKYRTSSYRIDLAYRGTDFCGWQTQDKHGSKELPLPAVQDLVQAAVNHRDVRVAGRTDAGVHAVGQVGRVRCDSQVTLEKLSQQLQEAAIQSGSWTCRRIMPVSRSFHPIFEATSRSYVYLLDANSDTESIYGDFLALVPRVNDLLAPLVGQSLPYAALSYKQTKTQNSDCLLSHAQVRYLKLDSQPVLSIELTGNRFLRRMVRILVSTTLSLAAESNANYGSEALLQIIRAKDRTSAARPAPSEGLVFMTASFEQNKL